MDLATYKKQIFCIENEQIFNSLANWAFNYQLQNVSLFQQWHSNFSSNNNFIPFLPIEFFKTHKIVTKNSIEKLTFESSGTTNLNTSKHFIVDSELYKISFFKAFKQFFKSPDNYAILGLLPNYLERSNSSLVYMVKHLMEQSANLKHNIDNAFYLNDLERLITTLNRLEKSNIPTILFGVTFALLDLAEKYDLKLKNTIVIETGGMKGRKKEITRSELYEKLKFRFKIDNIYSEYGMTELLSQAYSKDEGQYFLPNWMKIVITDINDPLAILPFGATGVINVIDLANIHSCCFIKTSDLGVLNKNGSFKVLGRKDNSDVRGCSLLSIN